MSELNVTTAVKVLNDGRSIPIVGLGVYQATPEDTYEAVTTALKIGYRHIDTAQLYGNEADVGRAVKDSGIPREELWITSKLWPMDLYETDGYNSAVMKGKESYEELGTYIDLYLLHSPHHPDERIGMYRGLEELQRLGIVKSIGVSNFGVHHLKELLDSRETTVVPAVNQIEIHPFLHRDAICDFCEKNNIVIEAYSPLAKATRMDDTTINAIAKDHDVSPAQVMIRWSIQCGYVTLPKSVKEDRIRVNADVFSFELQDDEMKRLNKLNQHYTTGWDPTKLK
eukprot:CFRG5318T1